ncbi:MAG: hypothetical protein IIC13_09640 [SAR324 cluster bacterium]|nr:hypothetical protein [SAR324 cluster bacterium]
MTEPAPKTHPPYIAFGGNIYAVPSLHGRVRFAGLVRRAFFALRPDAIAVELPATLEPSIRAAVARLPYLSVVAYDDFDDELKKVRQILPITPDDSLAEAVRLGESFGVPVHLIDRDVVGYKPEPIRAPDDYLIDRLGLEAYWRAVEGGLERAEAGSHDGEREVEMAARLRELSAGHRRVLYVCGLSHLTAVMEYFAGEAEPAPGAVTQREHLLFNLAEESTVNVLGSLPYHVYAYELARRGLHPSGFPQLMPLPNTKGGELTAAKDAYREALETLLAELAARPVVADDVEQYTLLAELVQGAVKQYAREWNEQPSPARLTTLMRFARNLALVGKRLTPSRYELILSGKNTVNDDFAFQLLRLCDHYPFFEENSALPEMKVEGDLTKGEAEGETLVLRLRLPRALQQEQQELLDQLELEEPPEEVEQGSWEERWEDGEHHVSHLPQDTKLENFFTYIREKCRRILSEQQVRIHKMESSLMDGLDLRETLRNLPMGKVYVRENLPGVGDVGPVVAIFHKPGEEGDYPHEKMWFSEHAHESDLALYSTNPGQMLDGPGISRCQYGGVLSLFPPTGRASVWGNPRYGDVRNRSERLLKAAIDLSRKPIVAFVAAQGPSPETLSFAAAKGIHIMYVPLDTISADMIKRVRTFHVLADRYIRPLAHKYVH